MKRDFFFNMLLGVALCEAVLIGFFYWGDNTNDMTKVIATAISTLAIVTIIKKFMDLSVFGDLYRVGREIVPEFEKRHFGTVDASNPRSQLFRGFYLYEYTNSNLTVAWHKDIGIVARERMRLEAFKKSFRPEDAVSQPPPVTTNATQVREEGEDVQDQKN